MPLDTLGQFTLSQDFPADRDAGPPASRIAADKMDDVLEDLGGGIETLAALTPHWGGTSTGSANAYVLTYTQISPPITTGRRVSFIASFTNTGASTIAINGGPAKDIKRRDGGDLGSGDITSGHIVEIVYDGTNWIYVSSASLDATLTALAGVTTAADKLIYADGLDSFTTTDLTAYGRSLIAVTDEADLKALINLEIGVDVQAYDAELAAIAGLVSAADSLPYFTGSGTAALAAFTSFGRSLVDDNDSTAARATLGVTIGTHVQAWDADLDAVAALSSTGIAVRSASNTWAQRTIAGTANEIAVTNGDGVSGNPILSLPSSLTFTGKTITGGTFSSPNAITGLPTPTNDSDAATKGYVDSVAQGLDAKQSVRAATTANITLSGEQTIDGVSVVAGDRVLVKNQSSSSQNGIYVCASGAWTRATDMNAWSEVPGAFVFVEEGTANGNTGWTCTADAGGTIDSTSMPWTQFSGAGTYTADGSTLQLVGTQFSILDAELLAIAGLTSAADKVPYFTGSGTASTATLTSFGRSLIDDADATAARSTLGLGSIATQNANNVAITGGTVSGLTGFELVSTDAGAGLGPDLTIYRNSASPAANDKLGDIVFSGKDSAGNATVYARIFGWLENPTNGSETGGINFRVAANGEPQTGETAGLWLKAYDSGSGGNNVNHYVQLQNANNDGYGDGIGILYARGTSASLSAVQNGDWIGGLSWGAWDGSAYRTAASISAGIEGTPGSNDMPGYLALSVTPDGSGSPVDALVIHPDGTAEFTVRPNVSGSNILIASDIGSTVQAAHARLSDIASVSWTQGDLLYYNGSNLVRLAAGTNGQFLKTQGASANPTWATIPGGGDLLSTNNLSDLTNVATARTNLGLGSIATQNANNVSITGGAATLSSSTAGTPALDVRNTADSSGVSVGRRRGSRATPTANDVIYETWELSDSAGNPTIAYRQNVRLSTVTDGAETAQVYWGIMSSGSLVDRLLFTPTLWAPVTNDAVSLGSSSLGWSDLFLASGGIIDFANNNARITHSSGVLNVSTGSLQVGGSTVLTAAATQNIATSLTGEVAMPAINHLTGSSTDAQRYGFVKDDTASADRTSAMQSLINNCQGKIILPPGRHLFTGAKLVAAQRHGLQIEGQGSWNDGAGEGTTIVLNKTVADWIEFRSCISPALRNVHIECITTVPTSGYAVQATKDTSLSFTTTDICLENVSFENVFNPILMQGTGNHLRRIRMRNIFGNTGILFSGTSGTHRADVLNVSVVSGDNPLLAATNYQYKGAWVASTSYSVGDIVHANSNLYLCTVAGTSHGSTAPSSKGTIASRLVTDNTVTWQFIGTTSLTWLTQDSYAYTANIEHARLINGAYGIRQIDSANTGSSYPTWLRGYDVDCDANILGGVYLDRGEDAMFTDLWVSSTQGGNGVTVGPNHRGGLRLNDSEVNFSAQHGVLLDGGTGNSVRGCQIGCNSRSSVGTYHGIACNSSLTDFELSNNRLDARPTTTTNDQGWGILVSASTNDHYRIVGNTGRGNQSGLLSDHRCDTTKQVLGNGRAGTINPEQFASLTSNRTLTNTTSQQAIFDSANDALTVEANTTYFFEAVLHLSGMSGTSGNFTFSLLGAGTATVASAKWHAVGLDSSTPTTAAAMGGSLSTSATGSGNIVTAATGTACIVNITGIFRISSGGTIIPSLGLTTATAATMEANSWFRCRAVGSNTVTAIGAWA